MTRKMIAPLLFGLVGAAILMALGLWQVQRLAWKQGILAEIEARIEAEPAAVPAAPTESADRYRPVRVSGQLGVAEVDVLVSHKQLGPGYRVITSIDDGQRRFLLDRGFVPPEAKNASRPPRELTVTGTLHWPDERTGSTPMNDIPNNVWFARDLADLATTLGAEPVLIVARSGTGDGVTPLPVGTEGIPNDHLHYAITWFSLALVWLGMTAYYLWRMKRRASKARKESALHFHPRSGPGADL